jgi:hypothetical protein
MNPSLFTLNNGMTAVRGDWSSASGLSRERLSSRTVSGKPGRSVDIREKRRRRRGGEEGMKRRRRSRARNMLSTDTSRAPL